MRDFITILEILLKYGEVDYPFYCEHDVLHIYPAVSLTSISPEDIKALDEMGVFVDEDNWEGFMSFKYGSC